MGDKAKVEVLYPSPLGQGYRLAGEGVTERKIRRRVSVFIGVFALSGLLSMAYVFVRPAIYESTATLLVTPPVPSEATEGTAATLGALAQERQMLTSPSLLATVLERLNAQDLLGGLPLALAEMRGMVLANQVADTQLIELRAEGPNAGLLAPIVNTWVEVYLEQNAAQVEAITDVQSASLQEQSVLLEERVAEKRREIEQFRKEYDIDSMTHEENRAAKRLTGLTDSLNEAETAEVSAEAGLAALQDAIAQGKPVGRRQEEQGLANLETRAAELREEMEEYEQRFTPEYMALDPSIRALADKLELIEGKIEQKREELASVALTEAEQAVASARQATSRLRAQLLEFQQTAADFTSRFAEHEALGEELAQLELLYRETKDQELKSEIGARLPSARASLLEAARAPERPIRPNYLRDAGFGLAGSALLAFLMVIVYELFTRPVRPGEALESRTVFYPWAPAQGLGHDAPPPSLPGAPGAPRLERDPRMGLALENQLPRELSRSEVEALLVAASPDTRLLIGALMGGVSLREASRLRWADFGPEQNPVRLNGPRPRTLALSRPVREAFDQRAAAEAAGDAAVWRDPAGHALAMNDLEALIVCAAHDAGLDRAAEVTSAALRHTYIAYLVRQGMRLGDIEKVAGDLPPVEVAGYAPFASGGRGKPWDEMELLYPALEGLAVG